MKEFTLHKAAITSMDFHPDEYLLTTASADRTVKMWNLETFKAVGSSDIGAGSVQAVKFWSDTKSVLAAYADKLSVFPVKNMQAAPDSCEADWGGGCCGTLG